MDSPAATLSTSTCQVPAGLIAATEPGAASPPRAGDLLLVEVTAPGEAYGREGIEVRTSDGTPTLLKPLETGTRFFAALGHREAAEAYDAEVPPSLDDALEVVARCGLIGRMTGNHWGRTPTRVRVLGRAVDTQGVSLNTRDHPGALLARVTESPASLASRLLVFTADGMNAGKSTAMAASIAALRQAGVDVAVGRLTGTTWRSGLETLRKAGAKAVADFSDLGHATTVGLDEEELTHILRSVSRHLAREVPGGCVLLELADGFLQRETRLVLRNPWLRDHLDKLVLCLREPAREATLVEAFRHAVDLPIHALSGRAAHRDGHRAPHALPSFDAATEPAAALARLLLAADEPTPG